MGDTHKSGVNLDLAGFTFPCQVLFPPREQRGLGTGEKGGADQEGTPCTLQVPVLSA